MSRWMRLRTPHCSALCLRLVALAVQLDEHRHVRRHVVEAGRARRLELEPEDVERLEVELRGVDADLLVGVVHRHVAEGERRLLPVLRLEVGAARGRT